MYLRKGYDPAARENITRRAKIALPEPISEQEKDKLVRDFYIRKEKLEKKGKS
jgi:hypothetical protein